ncbi:MAG: glycosyltransferase [Pseudoxanthomonas sp.]
MIVPGRVSVVMPAYNAAATLPASMRSVLVQSHSSLELLVIDDGSKDASRELAEHAAAEDARVRPLRLPRNGGVAAARNAGIEAACGEYIAFLDSDDQWHPHKLRAQLHALQASGAQVGYAGYRRVDAAGNTLSVVRPPSRVGHADMLRCNHIGNLTGLYMRALGELRFTRAGHEDYVFWLQALRLAGRAVCAEHPEPLASYLVQPGSLSSNKLRAARWQWRIYRDHENLGLLPSSWYFAHYATNALRKRVG